METGLLSTGAHGMRIMMSEFCIICSFKEKWRNGSA